jgi:hypothetical protein
MKSGIPNPFTPQPTAEYLAARMRDRGRLQAIKARLAALPPAQRKRVAALALKMSQERRARQTPTGDTANV